MNLSVIHALLAAALFGVRRQHSLVKLLVGQISPWVACCTWAAASAWWRSASCEIGVG